jgi:hypothetical protein
MSAFYASTLMLYDERVIIPQMLVLIFHTLKMKLEENKVLYISTLELQQAKLNIFLYLSGNCRRKYNFSAQCHQAII